MMKKTALVLMIFIVLTKVSGFFREIVLAYFFGASNTSDAYLISLTIPEAIFEFIGAGIATSFIPIYSHIKNNQDGKNEYINNVLNILIVLCSLVVIIVYIFTPNLVKIFASGFTRGTLNLAVLFTRITIISIYFTGILHILKSFLQINNKFIVSAIVGILFNLVIIFCIILSFRFNLVILAIGTVLAKALEVFFVLPFCYKKKYRYKLFLNLRDDNLKKMIFLALPVIIGVSVNQINVLIDKTLASSIAIGGISALNYANRLNLFVQGMFVISISTAMYPMISKMAAENNINGLKRSVSEAIGSVNLLVIPATIGAMIFAEPIVRLLFSRGAFDHQALSMTSNALFYYSIGMLGYGFQEILSRGFYSLQDTKTPMIYGAIAMAMNIILNIILSRFMGVGGLALATSISAIFSATLLFISFRKKIGLFSTKNMAISAIKIMFSSFAMGIIAKLTYSILSKIIGDNLALLGSICIGAFIYFIMIYFMNIDEVNIMVSAIKQKLKKSNREEDFIDY